MSRPSQSLTARSEFADDGLSHNHSVLYEAANTSAIYSAANASHVSVAAPPPATGASLEDEVTFISGVDATGHVSGHSGQSWNGDDPATYNPTDANLHKFGGSTAGTAGTVTYFFDAASNWNAAEKAGWIACMSLWSAVANVTFSAASSASAASLDIIRDPNQGAAAAAFGGHSKVGSTTIDNTEKGTISAGPNVVLDGPLTAVGGYGYGASIHELGHVIGLGHAGPYNGAVDPTTQQLGIYDTHAYSTMSYVNQDDTTAKYYADYKYNFTVGVSADGYKDGQLTPMMVDILAAQRLYGAPVNTPLDGGQTFGFHTTLASDPIGRFFDFTQNVNPIITLFDTGTHNTLDLSGYSTNSIVDLTPGTFSSADGMVNNIAIALNTIIETAIGGSGNDKLTGTSVANDLQGGGGSDTLNGGGGADTMIGGAGNDLFYVDNAGDQVTEATGGGTDTLFTSVGYVLQAGQSVDVLTTTSRAGTGDSHLTGNELSQTIEGNYGANVLTDGGGGDTMYGYLGNDIYFVSNSADKVYEAIGEGADTVYASVSFALSTGQSIDYLATAVRTATTAINLSGNEQAQRIDGNYGVNVLTGAAGNDSIYGFDGNDTINGGNGHDVMDGGTGNDIFVYSGVVQSTGVNRDLIQNMNFAQDKFDFTALPTGIDAKVVIGSLSEATFDSDLAKDIGATQLAAHHAVLFTPSAGDDQIAGHMFLIVDVNGTAGYQAGADYVIELQSASGTLTLGDFT